MKPETIIKLTRAAAAKVGHPDSSVTIVENGVTFYDDGGGLRQIPKWGVRVTRANGMSTRINFDTVPEHTEDQITSQIVELLRQGNWK